jgi:hypothetical protein
MKQQKIIRTFIDLDNTEQAHRKVVEAAGPGDWRVISIAPLENLTRSMQESPGGGELEAAGANPVGVLAVVEEA